MTKVTLNNVGSLIDATTAQTTINNNNTTIQTAFDNTLSRDGTIPNQMIADLDMNGHRILNLSSPLTGLEPVRLIDMNTASSGSFTQAGTGAVMRTMQDKMREAFSITDFGAVSGGSAAINSTSIAATFVAALVANKAVYIPAGNYSYNTSLVVPGVVPVFGDGQEQSILNYTGSGIGLLFQPSVSGTPYLGHYLRNFQLAKGGTGTVGIKVDLAVGAHYGNFDWHEIRVGPFSTASAQLVNAVGNTDGFFLGSIKRNYFENLITGTLIGDSINIEENKIAGTGDVSFSMVVGARSFVFSSNNVTNSGTIAFNPCFGATIESNQMELTVNYTGSVGSRVYISNSSSVVFRNNRSGLIGAITKPVNNILIDGTSSSISLDENELTKGTGNHILSATTTSDVVVGRIAADEGLNTEQVFLQGARSFQKYSNLAGVGDVNFTILPQYMLIEPVVTFTAARTWTLPAASAMRPGSIIRIVDLSSAISLTNTLTITRAGGDTINGGTSVVLSAPLSSISLTSDGGSQWYAITNQAGQWTPYTPVAAATTGTFTTSGRYQQIGKTIFVNIVVQLTSAVTGTFTVTLPTLSKSNAVISGKEIATIGTGAAGFVLAASNSLSVLNSAGSQYTANGNTIVLTGSYEAN